MRRDPQECPRGQGLDPAAGTTLASDTARYRFVSSTVDSKMLYTVALTGFGAYQDFLRSNAATHFVMVSDDDDIVPPAAFKSQIEAQLGHAFTVHSIASESVNESEPNTVVLCPTACSLVHGGGAIDIAFGCQPQILL